MPKPLTRIFFWLACVVFTAAALAPSEHLPELARSIWDKAEHAAAFGVLYLLGHWVYTRRRLVLVCSLLVFGAAIEVAQAATGWRMGDVADWVADAVGVALAVGLAKAWDQVMASRRARQAA
jgi:VanZ family protein